jgi:hypothetical protein
MSTGAAPPPASGGLKSTLKVAVPLLALVGVVFGVTYLAQYTPTTNPDDKGKEGAKSGPSGEPPLRFFTSARRWDPPKLSDPGYRHLPLLAPSLVVPPEDDRVFRFTIPDRTFQGFYEPDPDKPRATQFWFENRNPNSVTMQLKGVSCTSCTGGRLAAIPTNTTKTLLHHSALAALPIGPFNPFGVGLTQPGAALFGMSKPEGDLTPLQWTHHQFTNPADVKFQVPAANNPDGWSPQWGILELTFKVYAKAGSQPDPLRAGFATQVDGTPQSGGNDFLIAFESAAAFELSRMAIDVGKLDPLSGDREYEVILYSNTRGPGSEFGDLSVPNALVQSPDGVTDPVKFVEVTKIVRVPDAELAEVTRQLADEYKRLARARAAYRLTVVVRPKVGEARMDLGLLERTVSLAVSNAPAQQLTVKAVVRGSVWLDNDRTDYELKTFPGARGHTEEIKLTTEKPGTELAIVKGECKPDDFTYTLEKLPELSGQGQYKLKITIAPNQVFGQVKGVIVLEVKGPTPQRIRIPFKGQSTL